MTRYTDAALLKGDYAKLLAEPPQGDAWNDAACDNAAEAAATEIAKHIFAFNQSLDQETERLEVTTYSAQGLLKVLGLVPGDGDLLRIDGVLAASLQPATLILHANQLSLTFTRVSAADVKDDNDDGLQIGFVIFDELKKRKTERAEAKKADKIAKAKRKIKRAGGA